MPNWCNNFMEVGHEDPAKITALAEAYKRGEFCNHVLPVPQELKDTVAGHLGNDYAQELNQLKMQLNQKHFGATDWYDFCVNRWGTKWDFGDDDSTVDVHPDGKLLTASFDTAWAPPVGIYEELVAQGYTVRAYYYESGMCFAGIYDNGSDECYQDWGDSQGAKDTLPEELDEFFCISESQAEYEESERMDEELYAFVKEGAEKKGLELKTQ